MHYYYHALLLLLLLKARAQCRHQTLFKGVLVPSWVGSTTAGRARHHDSPSCGGLNPKEQSTTTTTTTITSQRGCGATN
jgi:hypothetical protein